MEETIRTTRYGEECMRRGGEINGVLASEEGICAIAGMVGACRTSSVVGGASIHEKKRMRRKGEK